jgi:hypothetical protein
MKYKCTNKNCLESDYNPCVFSKSYIKNKDEFCLEYCPVGNEIELIKIEEEK